MFPIGWHPVPRPGLLVLPMAAFIVAPPRQAAPHILSGKCTIKGSVSAGAKKLGHPNTGVHNLPPESISKITARSYRPTVSMIGTDFLHCIVLLAQRCLLLHPLKRIMIDCDMPLSDSWAGQGRSSFKKRTDSHGLKFAPSYPLKLRRVEKYVSRHLGSTR